jgi:hypothetical protein
MPSNTMCSIIVTTAPLLGFLLFAEYLKDYELMVISVACYVSSVLYLVSYNADRMLLLVSWTMHVIGATFGFLRIFDKLLVCTVTYEPFRGVTCHESPNSGIVVQMLALYVGFMALFIVARASVIHSRRCGFSYALLLLAYVAEVTGYFVSMAVSLPNGNSCIMVMQREVSLANVTNSVVESLTRVTNCIIDSTAP